MVLTAFIRIIGHALAMLVYIGTAFIVNIISSAGRLLAHAISRLTGAVVEQDLIAIHPERNITPSESLRYEAEGKLNGVPQFIDDSATLPDEASAKQLIAKAKAVILAQFGASQPDLLSDDFQFLFPVVGPLTKADFVKQFSSFKMTDAFPDSTGNFFNFSVDPMEPNRVWFFSRAIMTHTGNLKFGALNYPATGKQIRSAPQVLSVSFDAEGKVYKLTGGYCVDRSSGDTGGLGGLFGVIHALGGSLPFPEGRPWRPSLEWEAGAKRLPQVQKEWQSLFGQTNASKNKGS